jgi:hypothetical protein
MSEKQLEKVFPNEFRTGKSVWASSMMIKLTNVDIAIDINLTHHLNMITLLVQWPYILKTFE